jgi:hypothetical protein
MIVKMQQTPASKTGPGKRQIGRIEISQTEISLAIKLSQLTGPVQRMPARRIVQASLAIGRIAISPATVWIPIDPRLLRPMTGRIVRTTLRNRIVPRRVQTITARTRIALQTSRRIAR